MFFSPSITYTSVFCSENLAMPFYLLSVLIFIKNINKSRTKGYIFIVSSIVLGIGNIFRMIAIVILIAYVIYSIMYLKENILTKLKKHSMHYSTIFFSIINYKYKPSKDEFNRKSIMERSRT